MKVYILWHKIEENPTTPIITVYAHRKDAEDGAKNLREHFQQKELIKVFSRNVRLTNKLEMG